MSGTVSLERDPLLERLAGAFGRTPPSARLKAALLFAGVRFHRALLQAGEWAFPNYMPHHLGPGEAPFQGRRQVVVPYLLRLEDDTQVRLRFKDDSPFAFEETEDPRWFVLTELGRPVARTTFEPRLAWADAMTADGTPLRATGLSQHGDMLVLDVAPGCEYFVVPGQESGRSENLSCKFCLYGLPDQRMKPLGQELFVVDVPGETLDRVIEAASRPDTFARQLYLVGGSMLDMAAEGARYVQIARRVAEAGLTDRYYVACGSGAIPRDAMLALRDAGVRGACFNLEVWDPVQFERVCPGKARVVGRDRWIASLEEAVEVFGEGNVMTAFVAGAELEGEGGFTEMGQVVDSAIDAGETLIPRGVQPVFSLHWKTRGKEPGVEPFYTLDAFLQINEALAQIRIREGNLINPEFFSRRSAYMQLEPDYDELIERAVDRL